MSSREVQSAAAAMVLAMSLAAPMPASAEAMRVVKDPKTGELRGPTAAETTAFEKAEAQLRAARSGTQVHRSTPQEITYSDGTVAMPLGEDTHMYSVATLAPDGSVRLHCLPAKQAQSLVKSPKKSAVVKTGAKTGHEHH